MGKTEKKLKENHATKVTKIPKNKRRKYGMNKNGKATLPLQNPWYKQFRWQTERQLQQ